MIDKFLNLIVSSKKVLLRILLKIIELENVTYISIYLMEQFMLMNLELKIQEFLKECLLKDKKLLKNWELLKNFIVGKILILE